MQNPITFMPTEASGNSAKPVKSSNNSGQPVGNSFNQFLSKEISSKKTAPKENSTNKADNKVENKIENKAVNQNTDTKPKAPDKAEKDPVSEQDNTDSTSNVPENTQTNGVQLIALVESLAQFTTKNIAPPSDTNNKDNAPIDASVPATTTNVETNLIDVTALNLAQKNDQIPAQAEFANILTKGNETATATLNSDKLVKTSLNALPSSIDSLTGTTENAKPDLISETLDGLKNALKTDLKLDQKSDIKGEFKVDVKPDLKTDLKPELKSDLRTDLRTELKADLKVDQKIQLSGSVSELGVKMAEISPSAQNFAQQIAISSGQINGANEVEHLAPRVGTHGWDQAVGQKIIWMVAGGQQTAELTLNPPDLGPMQVVLSLNNDQANATFISNQPEVRDALESAMPKLRQMMNDAGVQLSGFSVKSDSSNQGSQFADDRSFSRSKNNGNEAVNRVSTVTTTSNTLGSNANLGIVDTFA